MSNQNRRREAQQKAPRGSSAGKENPGGEEKPGAPGGTTGRLRLRNPAGMEGLPGSRGSNRGGWQETRNTGAGTYKYPFGGSMTTLIEIEDRVCHPVAGYDPPEFYGGSH